MSLLVWIGEALALQLGIASLLEEQDFVGCDLKGSGRFYVEPTFLVPRA